MKGGGEVTVARVAEIECQAAQIPLALFEPFEGESQPYLIAIRMQAQAGGAPERPAEMKDGAVQGGARCAPA